MLNDPLDTERNALSMDDRGVDTAEDVTTQWWLAVLSPSDTAAALRTDLHEIPLGPAAGELPVPGDHVIVLALPACVFIAAATAARLRPDGRPVLHLRKRVRAPVGHAVEAFALRPVPVCVAAWTRERLADMAGTFTRITHHDATRIEAALLTQAHAYGPAPTRPAHTRPRTPGRRALMEGRAASGTLSRRVR